MAAAREITIVGGGMITHDLLLPSIYHLQRTGRAGTIAVCALHSGPLRLLKESPELKEAFPEQEFRAYPDLSEDPQKAFPDLYREAVSRMPPRQVVVVAMPDQLHYEVIMGALAHDQHVLCVKPLVLKFEQAAEIERCAREKGLFVGIEYHKRFDRRSLMAKREYQLGRFGEFVLGEAKLIEPYYYRSSNFQQWFTVDKSDPFVYVGCHYVDLVNFITGLRPVEVSVAGVKGRFPNGNEAYMWANGRLRYENGALLTVVNGLGYPDAAAGSNDQGLIMFCEGAGTTGMIRHDDHFRGVSYCYLDGIGCGGSKFNYVSPDFYRLLPWDGPGYKPSGYGFDSVAGILETVQRIEDETAGLPESSALEKRRQLIRKIDQQGLIATPANSSANELVIEAARISILNDGLPVKISYQNHPRAETTSADDRHVEST